MEEYNLHCSFKPNLIARQTGAASPPSQRSFKEFYSLQMKHQANRENRVEEMKVKLDQRLQEQLQSSSFVQKFKTESFKNQYYTNVGGQSTNKHGTAGPQSLFERSKLRLQEKKMKEAERER